MKRSSWVVILTATAFAFGLVVGKGARSSRGPARPAPPRAPAGINWTEPFTLRGAGTTTGRPSSEIRPYVIIADGAVVFRDPAVDPQLVPTDGAVALAFDAGRVQVFGTVTDPADKPNR